MSFDQILYTPPPIDDLADAVEYYQRAASTRFFGYYRNKTRRPTSQMLRQDVAGLRHLTAIHRTLRKVAGPIFDEKSRFTPAQRARILNRRLYPEDFESSSISDFQSAKSACHGVDEGRSRVDAFSSANGAALPDGSSFSSACSADKSPSSPPLLLPPSIEDLVEAVGAAQLVFADRGRDVQSGRLDLTSDEFALDILSLRDLTAIQRTLHRMCGKPQPEDESLSESDLIPAIASSEATTETLAALRSHYGDATPDRELALQSPGTPSSNSALQSESSEIPAFESEKSARHGDVEERSRVAKTSSSSPSNPVHHVNPVKMDSPIRQVPPVPDVRPIPRPRALDLSSRRASDSISVHPRASTVENDSSSLPSNHLHHVNPVKNDSSESESSEIPDFKSRQSARHGEVEERSRVAKNSSLLGPNPLRNYKTVDEVCDELYGPDPLFEAALRRDPPGSRGDDPFADLLDDSSPEDSPFPLRRGHTLSRPSSPVLNDSDPPPDPSPDPAPD